MTDTKSYPRKQFVVAYRLASAHGHLWANVCDSLGSESSAQGEEDGAPWAPAGHNWSPALVYSLCCASEEDSRLPGGIYSPGENARRLVHSTGTGRLEWRVQVNGDTEFVVRRASANVPEELHAEAIEWLKGRDNPSEGSDRRCWPAPSERELRGTESEIVGWATTGDRPTCFVTPAVSEGARAALVAALAVAMGEEKFFASELPDWAKREHIAARKSAGIYYSEGHPDAVRAAYETAVTHQDVWQADALLNNARNGRV